MESHPVCTFFRAVYCGLRGRLRFPRRLYGRVLTIADGEKFTIFRQAEIKTGNTRPAGPGAVFRIRFQFTGGSTVLNKRLSLIPIPLIVGFPGFRTKIWTFHEATGAFQGIYEWDSAEAAADYAKSLAIRLMKKRAVPESVDQEIIPDTRIGEYLSINQ
ncbi:MAG: YdhR family protein [Deltaproteobacteria bacterium]|nr:YdhR family protein [Deltaproteobacteria bacterium]